MEMINILCYIITLLYASIYDYKYLTVQNRINVIITILAVISADFTIWRVLVAFLFTLPILLLAAYKNSIGGGDIKFIFSNILYLGFSAGYAGLIIGLPLAVLFALASKYIFKKQTEKIPLVPFLSIGFLVTIIMRVIVN
jgi:prepilin signal peptidase PulO-like enzyme (type II secretory pathway)